MNMTKLAIVISAGLLSLNLSHASAIDTDAATVTLNIGKYAQITNLDDFALTLENGFVDGDANAFYSGKDTYNLEANSGVNVQLSSYANLSNGSDEVPTSYDIDLGGNGAADETAILSTFSSFDTVADAVHNASHVIGARAQLGDISSQKAGGYSADIVMTVSSL